MEVKFLLLLCLLSVATAQVLRGTTSFATRLYDVLPGKNENLIFSPLSVHTALSMTYQGAGGNTAESLQTSLSVPEADVTAREYKDIMTQLNTKGNVTIEVANKIYLKESYRLQDNFRDVIQNKFFGDVQNIDFSKRQQAADEINAWVREKTHEKIDKLVSANDFNGATRAVLLNAIYFKGLWASQFDKNKTKLDKFYTSETRTVDCEMMFQRGDFDYANNRELDAQLVKLKYRDSRFSMVIVLPNQKTGIEELERKLANVDITSLLETNFYETEVLLYLPKFKIESTIDLNGPLKQIGLETIFSDGADFSNMIDSDEPLKVSKVIQKAFIEVNEEGAEAAAVTGIKVVPVSLDYYPPPPRLFRADHPFVSYLTTTLGAGVNKERVILFVGRVNKL